MNPSQSQYFAQNVVAEKESFTENLLSVVTVDIDLNHRIDQNEWRMEEVFALQMQI